MFTHGIRCLALTVCFVGWFDRADAAPITYNFSGTLSQPYNGSTQFSGAITYATDLPLYPGVTQQPGWSVYSGVPLDPSEPIMSLTFTLGNTSSSTFGGVDQDEMIVGHSQGIDDFSIYEELSHHGNQTVYVDLAMLNNNLTHSGPFSSTIPPSSLNLADFSMETSLNVWSYTLGAQGISEVGRITSLVAASGVPEPASLFVFASLGVALYLRSRTNRRRDS